MQYRQRLVREVADVEDQAQQAHESRDDLGAVESKRKPRSASARGKKAREGKASSLGANVATAGAWNEAKEPERAPSSPMIVQSEQ